jgi:hypothetical protein
MAAMFVFLVEKNIAIELNKPPLMERYELVSIEQHELMPIDRFGIYFAIFLPHLVFFWAMNHMFKKTKKMPDVPLSTKVCLSLYTFAMLFIMTFTASHPELDSGKLFIGIAVLGGILSFVSIVGSSDIIKK